MRVVGYIRVSGAGQVEKDGPVRQSETIRAFCALHRLEQVKSIEDLAVTGKMDGMDRPGFAQFLIEFDKKAAIKDTARENPRGEIPRLPYVEAIVVERNDRWARDLVVSELMVKELRDRGLKLFFCDQGLVDQVDDSGDPTKTLIRQILSALAEWDRAMQVLKLAGARARIRAAKGRCEGAKPYGARQGEAQILAAINKLRGEGQSWASITEFLNRGGMLNRSGRPWIRSSVQSIWQNANRVDKSPEIEH